MEAPPPLLSTAPPTAAATPAAAVYPDSLDSSPRSRHTDSWDTEPPPPQPPQKLRLMCSYSGHIVPRPHDKTLCYIGGDTRIIVIDRQTSLSDLRHRLSKTLFNNQSFSLKYQLPTEDLDSLISVTTDEDLENMVEEYDRLNNAAAGGTKTGRIRLFLFPQSSANIEQLLVETASTKSDDWFFNALNGKASTLSAAASDRGFSESSSVNCLLGLDDESVGKTTAAGKDVEAQNEGRKVGGNGNSATNQDVHSVPDSPMLETTSSFGSTSSSPSVANLPPIRVHVEENQKVGIEDQFQQMTVGMAANANFSVTPKAEEVGGFTAAGVSAGAVASGVPVMVGGDQHNRVISDDERSDPGGYRRVQQIQQQVQSQVQMQQISQAQFQQKQSGGFELASASPDSASSEGSMKNPLSRQRQAAMYQEPIIQIQSGNNMVAANPADPRSGDQNANKIQMQQVQESSYVMSSQYEPNHPQMHHPQQQFVHAGNQYIPAGAMPFTSYYSVYPSQQQHHPQHQPVLDQQQQYYFVPARQTQAYNMPVQQQAYSEMSSNAPSSRTQTPSAAAVAPHVAYSQPVNVPSSKPEMAAGVYRTAAGASPHMVQVPSSQQHQPQPQYVGFTQIHHPSQMMAPTSAPNSNYTYEFTDPPPAQMYYTQAMPPQFSAQYQTMTSTPQGMSSDASSQASSENMKQQVRSLPQQ